MENNTLIVLGMHRSGTSLITQWLHKCGLHVGDNLLGADTGNVEGHFEDLDFVRLHEDILRSQNLPDSGLVETPIKQLDFVQTVKLKNLIAEKNSRQSQWGWKDPRTCLFLDIYRKVLPDARYLIILRDYKEVVSSLLKRDVQRLQKKLQAKNALNRLFSKMRGKYNIDRLYKLQTEKYLKVWIAYNEQILNHIEQLPTESFAVVNYKSLVSEDRPVFLHLVENWNYRLNYNGFNSVYKQQLMGAAADIDAHIIDKSLLEKAMFIEASLQNMLLQHMPAAAKLFNANIA